MNNNWTLLSYSGLIKPPEIPPLDDFEAMPCSRPSGVQREVATAAAVRQPGVKRSKGSESYELRSATRPGKSSYGALIATAEEVTVLLQLPARSRIRIEKVASSETAAGSAMIVLKRMMDQTPVTATSLPSGAIGGT